MRYMIMLLFVAACGAVNDLPVGTEQEEMRYQCGNGVHDGQSCYCCFDDDDYAGCCMCPVTGAWCR